MKWEEVERMEWEEVERMEWEEVERMKWEEVERMGVGGRDTATSIRVRRRASDISYGVREAVGEVADEDRES
ncbi:hypothetical protein Pcinc_032963 [Petrolisthes cinctipes]|uniref:Uncharacterized protein n=1 Tax=Petrolisthes cinctipes TaxID=88211 RepID=A0AAE1ETD4_PETCI|nr:hypothetical protein Pcinc_032963 [Petrolisthes cinctipes]